MAVAKRNARIAGMATVRVVLRALAAAAPLGLCKEQRGGSFVVTSVSGLARGTAKVVVGLEVVGVIFGGDKGFRLPTNPGGFSAVLRAGHAAEVELPIPFHDAARKGIHKQTRVKMVAGQLARLKANVP